MTASFFKWPGTSIALATAFACGILVSGCATTTAVGTDFSNVAAPYTLSSAEKNWHCDSLDNALQARVTKIAALMQQAKVESEAVAPTLSKMLARTFGGPGTDLTTLQQIKPERAAADAYNDALKSKGCKSVDIDAKLPAPAPPFLFATNSR